MLASNNSGGFRHSNDALRHNASKDRRDKQRGEQRYCQNEGGDPGISLQPCVDFPQVPLNVYKTRQLILKHNRVNLGELLVHEPVSFVASHPDFRQGNYLGGSIAPVSRKGTAVRGVNLRGKHMWNLLERS